MNNNGERTLVTEFYDDINDFLKDLSSISVRKLTNENDKKLIQKLKRWQKQYWDSNDGMDLYESQARRLKEYCIQQNIETKIKVD